MGGLLLGAVWSPCIGPTLGGAISLLDASQDLAESATSDVVLGPSPDTGEPEHHEWRWVSFDEAYDLASPRVREVVRWARQIIGT